MTRLLIGSALVGLTAAALAYAAAPAGDDDPARLRGLLAYFDGLPAGERAQIRDLDRQLHELPDGDRLERVMCRYSAWLDRLPEADRNRVESARDAYARRTVVHELRDQEYVDALPPAQRDAYARAKTRHEKGELVKESARRGRSPQGGAGTRSRCTGARLKDDELRKLELLPRMRESRAALEAFAKNIEPALTEQERKQLIRLRLAGDDDGRLWSFAVFLHGVAEKYAGVLLPGPEVAGKLADLPKEVQTALVKGAPGTFGKDKPLPKELADAARRWPQFGVAVVKFAAARKIALPVPLGPTKRDELPADVRDFVEKVLEPSLGAADLKRLKDAAGRWPDYPQAVMALAHEHKPKPLPVPGWTLPENEAWKSVKRKKPAAEK